MGYRVDPEKALGIVNALYPQVIYVNGPARVGKSAWTKQLQEMGYSVLSLDKLPGYNAGTGTITDATVGKVAGHLARRHKLAVEGYVAMPADVCKLFGDYNWSYCYFYPNHAGTYHARLGGTVGQTNTALNTAKSHYNEHLEYFEEHVLTILLSGPPAVKPAAPTVPTATVVAANVKPQK